VEKKKVRPAVRRFRPDSNLTPEDDARFRWAFKYTFGQIRKLRKSQIEAYGLLRQLKKRLKELEKRVSSFIEPS
jgi:hypothetical protein